MNRFIAGVAMIAALVACGASHAAGLNTNYVVSNRDAVGVIRAFDDGSNTVLQFVDLDHQQPLFTDKFGKRISYRRVGDYAVLPGIKDTVRIAVDGHEAEVRAAAETPIAWPVKIGQAPAPNAERTGPAKHEQERVATAPARSTSSHASAAATPVAATKWPTAIHPMTPTRTTLAVAQSEQAAAPKAAVAPAASHTDMPAPVAKREPIWQAEAGSDAKSMLVRWAHAAHWRVEWDAPFTYPIESPLSYRGDFVTAVAAHFAHYTDRHETDQPICVDMHRANATVHVYLPDDSNQCNDRPKAMP